MYVMLSANLRVGRTERKQKNYFIFTNCILVDECEKPQVFAHLVSCIIWCSLVEGDEQLDRPNSQTCMCCIGGGL